MRSFPRKTTPKVKDGKVQRKNRTARSRGWRNYYQDHWVIDRERPGQGYRHILLKRDIERFIDLLPEWEELSKELDVILLATKDPECYGWHRRGIVAVCAWERDLHQTWPTWAVDEDRPLLDRLGVPVEKLGQGAWRLRFDEGTVRAFQLMHVLLHELGHHHDRITTRSRKRASRGEDYANSYARRYSEELWEAYTEEFGW
jgi:hypothetical protein